MAISKKQSTLALLALAVSALAIGTTEFISVGLLPLIDVASAINMAAFNARIAIDSYLGGLITDSIGLIHMSWIGALMVLVAAVLTGFSRALERKDQVSKI